MLMLPKYRVESYMYASKLTNNWPVHVTITDIYLLFIRLLIYTEKEQ